MSRVRAFLAILALTLLVLLGIFYLSNPSTKSSLQSQQLASEPELLQFLQWMQKYHKNYQNSEEFEFRYSQWLTNRAEVVTHNQKGSKFEKRLNHLADLTQAELSGLGGGRVIIAQQITDSKASEFEENRHKDWRQEGAVTEVKSQGVCNSGYAFAAIGALEGLNFIHNKNLLTFSAQQIIDCTHPQESESCYFGYIQDAFYYLQGQSALLDSDYPYEAVQKKCTPNVSLGVITIGGHQSVRSFNLELQNAVDRQPIAAYIDPVNLHNYDGGIIQASDCGTQSTHGVLVTGYNTDDPNNSYWIIKNSWSTWWGEYGYARLQLGPNTCGILNSLSYPEF